MALLTTTTAAVSNPVNYFYLRGLLSTANVNAPYMFGGLPSSIELQQGTATVKWRRIENLTPVTTALGEPPDPATFGMGRSSVKPTVTDVTAAIAKYGNAIIVGEEIDLFQVNSNTTAFINTLGINAGESLNQLMRDVHDGATTARYGGGVASTATIVTAMSKNDIKYVVNQLDRNSAMKFSAVRPGNDTVGSQPIRDAYLGICHPDVEQDIRTLSGFVGYEQYAGFTDVYPGEFGYVEGVRWISTPAAPINTGAGTTSASGFRGASDTANDVYSSFVYGKEAFGTVGLGKKYLDQAYKAHDARKVLPIEIIQHERGSSGVADMFNEVGTVAWKAWFAGKILNANWHMKIETLSADL